MICKADRRASPARRPLTPHHVVIGAPQSALVKGRSVNQARLHKAAGTQFQEKA